MSTEITGVKLGSRLVSILIQQAQRCTVCKEFEKLTRKTGGVGLSASWVIETVIPRFPTTK